MKTDAIKLSMKLIADGEFEEAYSLLAQEIIKDSTNPELYCRLNTALSYLQRYGEAEEATEKALKINSEYPRANYLKALELAEKGEAYNAIKRYKIAIENYPQYEEGELRNIHLSEAHNNLGSIYYRLGKIKDARREWLLAVRYDPKNNEARKNLRDFKQKPITNAGYYYEFLNDACVKLSEKNRLKEAIGILGKAISLNPDEALAYHNIGLIYGKVGDFQNCANFLKKFVELSTDNLEVDKIKKLIQDIEKGKFKTAKDGSNTEER